MRCSVERRGLTCKRKGERRLVDAYCRNLHSKHSHNLYIIAPLLILPLHQQMFNRKNISKRNMQQFSSFLGSTYLLCNVGPSPPSSSFVRNNVLCARFLRVGYYKQDGTIPKVQDPHFVQQKQKLEDGWKNLHFAFCLLSCELWESVS